jgi:hypothetical protein
MTQLKLPSQRWIILTRDEKTRRHFQAEVFCFFRSCTPCLFEIYIFYFHCSNHITVVYKNPDDMMIQLEWKLQTAGDRLILYFFSLWHYCQTWAVPSSYLTSLYQPERSTRVGRTNLDEWSARRRDLYLTTHNNHIRKIYVPTAVFEPAISASERPQTYVLDPSAVGISCTRVSNI